MYYFEKSKFVFNKFDIETLSVFCCCFLFLWFLLLLFILTQKLIKHQSFDCKKRNTVEVQFNKFNKNIDFPDWSLTVLILY